MFKWMISIGFSYCIFLASGAVFADGIDKNSVLDRDFNLMMEWFEGEFDNMEQVYFDRVLKVGEEEAHGRVHSIFKRVAAPAIGLHLFYVQQYSDGDPEKVYRQRLYRFSADYDRSAIALQIFSFKDAAAVKDAHLDPAKLEGLSDGDINAMPAGCTVFWQRRANQFVGSMDQGGCRIVSERSGMTLLIEDDLLLTENEIWIQDRATDEAGNHVFGNKAGVAHKLLKQQLFTCWIYAKDDAAESGGHFKNGLKISDQGGEIWLPLTEEGKKVGVKMRNVHWPYGNNRNSLVLYAHNDDSGRAVSYAWTEPDAKRIALNLRWVQASCTRDD